MPPKRAYEIEPGKMVSFILDEEAVICLKALRQGRDFIHHYLVPLSGQSRSASMALIYVDPEAMLDELENSLRLALGEGEAGTTVSVGEIFANPSGKFLKVQDTDKTQRLYAYVEIETGDVRIRQERNVSMVFRAWGLE
jgi:hypothetical protein